MGKGDRMNLYNTSHCMDKTAAEAIQKAEERHFCDSHRFYILFSTKFWSKE